MANKGTVQSESSLVHNVYGKLSNIRLNFAHLALLLYTLSSCGSWIDLGTDQTNIFSTFNMVPIATSICSDDSLKLICSYFIYIAHMKHIYMTQSQASPYSAGHYLVRFRIA